MKDWDAETAAAMNDEPVELTDEEFMAATGGGPAEPTPEEYMATAPLFVVVLGSMDWDEPVVVQAALLAWAQHHRDRAITVVTTGAPGGAEDEARRFAEMQGWHTIVIAPEQLLDAQMMIAVSFAFVKPGSKADEFTGVYASRHAVRRFTVETLRPITTRSDW